MKKLISILLFLVAVVPLFGHKQPRIVIPLNSDFDSYWYFWTGEGDLRFWMHLDTRGQHKAHVELPNPDDDTHQYWLWMGAWDDVRQRWVYSAWHYVGGPENNDIVRDIGPQGVIHWWDN